MAISRLNSFVQSYVKSSSIANETSTLQCTMLVIISVKSPYPQMTKYRLFAVNCTVIYRSNEFRSYPWELKRRTQIETKKKSAVTLM